MGETAKALPLEEETAKALPLEVMPLARSAARGTARRVSVASRVSALPGHGHFYYTYPQRSPVAYSLRIHRSAAATLPLDECLDPLC